MAFACNGSSLPKLPSRPLSPFRRYAVFPQTGRTDRQAEDRAGHRTYYVEGFDLIWHDSFAGIENAAKSHRPVAPLGAIVQADGPSADILAGSRSLIAVFRQAFSYRSEQAIQTLRKARYCQVSIYQVRPEVNRISPNSSNRDGLRSTA